MTTYAKPIVDIFANRPTSAVPGAAFMPTDGGYMQVYNGTIWQSIIGGCPCTPPPAASSFGTAINSGTLTGGYDTLNITCGTVGTQLFGKVKSIGNGGTGANFSVEVGCSVVNTAGGTPGSSAGGIMVRDSVSGKFAMIACGSLNNGTSDASNFLTFGLWGSATSRTSHTDLIQSFSGPLFLRITGASSTITYQCSQNRAAWTTLGTSSYSSAFSGNNPTDYGPCAQQEAASSITFFHGIFT